MGLYDTWMQVASTQRSQQEQKTFWENYFSAEKDVYAKILDRIATPYKGKLADVAKELDMENVVFTGFIDGINTSLKAGEYDLDALELDSEINLEVDINKLYYNMVDAKADWLYNLPQWDSILTKAEREEINKQYKKDNIFIAKPSVGRNDPCTCGSGKKYKKCCGANKKATLEN